MLTADLLDIYGQLKRKRAPHGARLGLVPGMTAIRFFFNSYANNRITAERLYSRHTLRGFNGEPNVHFTISDCFTGMRIGWGL